jgi:hypothetical protein
MTREEAKNRYNGMPIVFQVIDKIYDELESRICENCKEFSVNTSGFSECNILNVTISKDFGCNKWQQK